MNKFLILGLLLPVAAGARTLEAGAGKPYATPSSAIAEARPGDHVLIAPGQYFDCAVVSADGITIEGAGDAASVVLTDKTCQGKALLVIDGSSDTVRNLTLTRARVPDGNGAGIRAEGGDLTVDGVQFVNNQDGILTGDNAAATITVLRSRFLKNGVCLDYCAHAIYAGHIKMLRVSDSIFRETRDGHDIKSRAASTEVTGCDFADGPDGTASYAIELPNGGSLVARHNTIEKGHPPVPAIIPRRSRSAPKASPSQRPRSSSKTTASPTMAPTTPHSS